MHEIIITGAFLAGFFLIGLYWCGENIHKFGEYLHIKLTPEEK